VTDHYGVPKPNRMADAVLKAAKAGDWKPLDDYIAKGFPLPDSLRQYFRGLLPYAPRPPHRAAKTTVARHSLEIAAFVWRLKQDGVRDPIVQAANRFKLGRRKVQQACNEFEQLSSESREFILQAVAGKRPERQELRSFEEFSTTVRLK